jgi:hypothetical protein
MKIKTKKNLWRAYCFRNGVIQFQPGTAKPVEGSIAVGIGPKKKLMEVIGVLARESYPSKPGGKDTCLLIPGIPDADTDAAREKALDRFYREVRRRLHPKRVSGPYEFVIGRRGHLGAKGMENAEDIGFIRVKNAQKLNAPMPHLFETNLSHRDHDPRHEWFSKISVEEMKLTAQFFVDAANAAEIAEAGERTCVHCGCTVMRACKGGCDWVIKHKATPTGVCSRCVKKEIQLVDAL